MKTNCSKRRCRRLSSLTGMASLILIVAIGFGCGGGVTEESAGGEAAPPAAEYSFECPEVVDFNPLPEVRSTVEANEKAFLAAILAGDREALDRLLADEMSYVHENGQVSTKQQFFDDYLSKGYIEAAAVPKERMRQFCSTVTTVSTGHIRLNGEGEYPQTSVTHIWAKKSDDWVLVHRHESHRGGPIGEQLTMEGSQNDTGKVGARPAPEVEKIITANEAAWVKAMVDTDRAVMEELMGPDLQYVHVTDHTSTRADFMKELMGGFTETDFKNTTLRQFGNTVIALHNAHYRHVNEPDQSRSQAMHCWVKIGGKWQIVSRHSARFEPY